MARSHDSGFTPVKVRGKRHGTQAEKWYTGKRRKPELQKRPHLSIVTSSASSLDRSRKRRRRDEEESLLETLPTEVVQQIFEYSANVHLPSVSRRLAAKLSKSTHLEYQLTETILSPVLRLLNNQEPVPAQLAAATRLLNSRFMTYAFFKSWLQNHDALRSTHTVASEDGRHWCTKWAALQPSPNLLPPRKLLSSPFTEDKSRFLAVLVRCRIDLGAIDPAYREFALQGLQRAVGEGRRDVISLMLELGVPVSTELLRVAVIDAGCDKDVVFMLLDAGVQADGSSQSLTGVNLLDPPLWAWAEKDSNAGDEKGRWLVALLREREHRKATTAPSAEVSM